MGVFSWIFNTPASIGRAGEKRISDRLFWINLFGRKGTILKNVYLPHPDGSTTEIDLLYITCKGIFVIESKNYSGYIFGNENNRYWTTTLYAGKNLLGVKKVEKHRFYNPIWQNNSHIRSLNQYLGADIQMFSLIVFSDRCQMKDVSWVSPNVEISYRRGVSSIIRKIWREYPDSLCSEDINKICEKLIPCTNQNKDVKYQHVADIHSKFNSTETCPWCGGSLILRMARKGANAGQQFYGCANYPKCRYTKSI